MFPIELTTFHSVFATQHTSSTESRASVLSMYPPVPVVVENLPKLIFCEAFCASLHAFCMPLIRMVVPTAAVVGKVNANVPVDLLAKEPVLLVKVWSAVTTDHVTPPAIVICLPVCVIVMLEPEVRDTAPVIPLTPVTMLGA
jgi:hypothetical protein